MVAVVAVSGAEVVCGGGGDDDDDDDPEQYPCPISTPMSYFMY